MTQADHEAFDRPYAATCIKRDLHAALKDAAPTNLTVACDRADCWSDNELFKHKQAMNVTVESEFTSNPQKSPRSDRKSLAQAHLSEAKTCKRQAELRIELSIVVADCECDPEDCDCLSGLDKAMQILGFAMATLQAHEEESLARRIIYRGFEREQRADLDLDYVFLNARFEVQYILDPARPWVAG